MYAMVFFFALDFDFADMACRMAGETADFDNIVPPFVGIEPLIDADWHAVPGDDTPDNEGAMTIGEWPW